MMQRKKKHLDSFTKHGKYRDSWLKPYLEHHINIPRKIAFGNFELSNRFLFNATTELRFMEIAFSLMAIRSVWDRLNVGVKAETSQDVSKLSELRLSKNEP